MTLTFLLAAYLPVLSQLETVRSAPAELIPLSKAIIAFDQKDIPSTASQKLNKTLMSRLLSLNENGANELLLLSALNFEDAITATSLIMLGGRSNDSPAETDPITYPGKRSHWLAFRLGVSHGSPPAFEIISVTKHQRTVRMTYRRPLVHVFSLGLTNFMGWVHLGDLNGGDWTLELIEEGRSSPRLSRSVTVPPRDDSWRTIPLKTAYVNFKQDGVAFAGDTEANRHWINRIRDSKVDGSSNLFLVEAAGLERALAATATVLVGGQHVDTVGGGQDKSHWLAFYLGEGCSSPRAYELLGIGQKGNTIQVFYKVPRLDYATADRFHYMGWVPLGPLRPGDWAVELWQEGHARPRLARSITVAAPEKSR